MRMERVNDVSGSTRGVADETPIDSPSVAGIASPPKAHPTRATGEQQDVSPADDKATTGNYSPGGVSSVSRLAYAGDFRAAVERALTGIAELPADWDEMTVREQRDWVGLTMKNHCGKIPTSLLKLCVGSTVNGDCSDAREGDVAVPEWLDREKFARGQRFAMRNFAAISFGEILSLYTLFSFEHGLKPLIVTGRSSDPFTSFRRYLSTGNRVRNWLSSDVWTPGTRGNRDILAVRRMHANVREKLRRSTHAEIDRASRIDDSWSSSVATCREDFRAACRPGAPGQCPFVLTEAERFKRPDGLNQGEMAGTQFGFMGLVVLHPRKFGIHDASDEDLDAYCHVWRGLGYLLGIEDEFNFCNGSLEEVKQRSSDFLEYWIKPNLRDITPEWEHMMRCVVEGVKFYFPTVTYEHCLLYLADVLDISMPRLEASLSYSTWIRLNVTRFTFNWTTRLPGVVPTMNRGLIRAVERAVNYTDEELEALRKRSDVLMSKGIAETVAKKDLETATPKAWQTAPLYVFSSAFFLLSLPVIVKDYARKLLHVAVGSDIPG